MFGGLNLKALKANENQTKPNRAVETRGEGANSGDKSNPGRPDLEFSLVDSGPGPPKIDYDLAAKIQNPSLTSALSAGQFADPSIITALVYDKNSSTRKAMVAHLRALPVKRVIVVKDDSEARSVIERNNSQPLRTRNAVRLVVANLDVVAARIVEYVQSRFDGPLGRMETIPVLLTVNEETEGGVEAWSKSRDSSEFTKEEVRALS
jgi:hypothetical protein